MQTPGSAQGDVTHLQMCTREKRSTDGLRNKFMSRKDLLSLEVRLCTPVHCIFSYCWGKKLTLTLYERNTVNSWLFWFVLQR